MGIKQFLESQERRIASEFVSVKTLVEVLAEEQECSKSDVAKFLFLNIDHFGRVMPDLQSVDVDHLKTRKEVCADPLWPLREVMASNSFSDDSNLYGWQRDEISSFLRDCGLCPVPDFPEWTVIPSGIIDNQFEGSEDRRARLKQAVDNIRLEKKISIAKAFELLAGGEFGSKSNISAMYYPRKKATT